MVEAHFYLVLFYLGFFLLLQGILTRVKFWKLNKMFDIMFTMQYAIVRSGGKQYKVFKGDIIDVDKLNVEVGKETKLDDILLLVSDDKVNVGTPSVKDVSVKAKVLNQIKGEKVRVAKFKAKVRYRRVTGFRPQLTRLQIEEIVV